jgi:ribosomal protein S18 acetylase RimI-like enzyme
MSFHVRMANCDDTGLFEQVADDVFDNAVLLASVRSFLGDPHHHIGVAIAEGCIIGFASAVDYIHPDKPRELWINEIGVAQPWERQGIGAQLMRMILDHGRKLGCAEAWVLTEPDNAPANALYRSVTQLDDEPPATVVLHSYRLK